MDIEDKHSRVKSLFKDEFKLLTNSKILLLGVGGVGSFCLDCLYRSGIENITIVDFDKFDITNQNRQIGSEAIDQYKVDRLKELYPNITTINTKITPSWVDEFDFDNYDLVLDAIDDIPSKLAIIKKCYSKLIVSLGSAKKVDPTKIEMTTIDKTHTDPLARKIRTELKKDKFYKKFKVIFSSEESKDKGMGSFVGVTGSFGLIMCSKAMEHILLNSEK
jgi:tRNA A37 threonylcarbamoyladenosine dehydratase